MEPKVEPLQRKLDAARRWWRATQALNGLAWVVSLVVLLALVCYHWDSHWTLNTHGRETWRLVIIGAGVGALLIALLRPLLQRLPYMRMAADVERRYPVLRERLLTTLDLAPALSMSSGVSTASGHPISTFSPALAEAVAEETHQVASDLDFRRAVSLRPLRVGLLTMLFMLGLLALHVALAGPAFANWLRRMAYPHADIAPYAHTQVQVIPDALLLPVGEGDWITVKTWGDPAERCVLRVHQQGDQPNIWNSVNLTAPTRVPDGPGSPDERNVRRFRFHLTHLTGSIALVAAANDGHSNEREIEVAPRPTLLNVHLRMHFPAYMHRPDKTLDAPNGSFAAPYGTEVDITGIANNPLRSVTFLHDNVPDGQWKVDGKETFGRLSVYKDTTYGLKLTDYHHFDNLDVPRYVIHAEKDQTPTVEISRPAADIDLVPAGSLPLIAKATDDYGVVSMRLTYSKTHEDDSKVGAARIVHAGSGALALPGPDGSPQVTVQQRWHIASVAPRPGDTVQYEVDAVDNDTLDGPHIGRSMTYRVHVVSLPEMQQRLKEQLDEEQRDLQQLRQHQAQAQQQLEQARAKRDAGRMAQAQDAQRAVSQETQSLTERIQQLSNQLENNGLATQSELQRRDAARQMLQTDAQQKMPAAADTVQKAQNSASSERNQALNQADRQETDIRHDLNKASQLLSRTPTADQLAQEAARLAQQQQQLAEGSNSLAEDMRAQHQADPATKAGLETERAQQAQTNADTQNLQQQLKEAAKAAQERGDKQAAQNLQRAADALRQGNVKGNQQQAQNSLDHNNPQNASPAQSRAAQALQKAAQAAQQATGKPNDPSQSPADRLEQAAKDLQKMAQKQRELASKIGQHPDANQSRALAQQEQAMQQQANQAQQQLNGAQSAQQSLQNAQQSLGQASQQLGQNSSQSAQSPAQNAAQELQKAAQQAANAAQQLRQQQAAQELAAKVERLAQLQHGLHDATKRLDKARQDGNLTSNDLIERRQVGERQADAEHQARDLTSQFPSPAFQQAMRMASRQMHPASKNLSQDEPDTGTETQSAQSHAAQTLDTIARALKQQAQNGSQQSQQGDSQQGGSSAAQQQDEAAEALGELMLAQGLQQQLRQDTGALDKARDKNPDHALDQQQQQQDQQLTQGQRATQEITRRAGERLQSIPDAEQSVQEATRHMGQAGQRLEQQQTDQITQGHQDEALHNLDQAVQQAQQAMQQQQQQQQAMQQAQQGAPMPAQQQQKSSEPNHQAFTRLVGAQRGAMSAPNSHPGKFGGELTPRTQRALREGRNEKVPAEFQDLVNRYYKSLAEKQR